MSLSIRSMSGNSNVKQRVFFYIVSFYFRKLNKRNIAKIMKIYSIKTNLNEIQIK